MENLTKKVPALKIFIHIYSIWMGYHDNGEEGTAYGVPINIFSCATLRKRVIGSQLMA